VCSIYDSPVKAGFARWQFWQYANRDRIDGVGTAVDLNAFHGSRSDFRGFIDPHRPTGPDAAPKDAH
jgi:GH25 family lysozyme M1 (1,4-beta-N-acetylmuramidase)